MAKVIETKIDTLIPDDKNFNKGTEYGQHLMEKSFRKFGAGRSCVIDKNNRIIAGNKSAETFAQLGMDDIIVVETDGTKMVAVKRTDIDIDTKEGREMALADNATGKANLDIDEVLLKEVSEDVGINPEEWGIDISDEMLDVENNYSRKIESPAYEPNGEKVDIKDMCDKTKYEELIKEIDGANIPGDIKEFLRLSASRHIVFDYATIADYYCNAPKDIQTLMEHSALVIIDFKSAIQGGFVKLSEQIANQYLIDNKDE